MSPKKVLNALLIASIAIYPFSSYVIEFLGESDVFSAPGAFRYVWIVMLFAPIPISLIILSKRFSKKYSFKTNGYVVAAVIVLGLISFMTVSSLIYKVNCIYDDRYYIQAEEEARLDLPNDVIVASDANSDVILTYVKLIDKREIEVFETQVFDSTEWSKKLSSLIEGVIPLEAVEISYLGDAFLVYNVTEDSFDTSSFVEGEYEMIIFAYDKDLSRLIILSEFTAEIVK